MGITNLLKLLQPITQVNTNLHKFHGQICGIDASCWLHRAAHSCPLELIQNQSTDKYISYLCKCIQLLKRYNITLFVVFDGAALPMKSNVEFKRNSNRISAKQKALYCLQTGDIANAYKYAKQAVRITSDMVTKFIKLCIKNDIKYVCAPYEADAQLAYLYKTGSIDFVISEDSDLLVYGVKQVLYKFNLNGYGDFIDMNKITTYVIESKDSGQSDLCAFLKQYPEHKNLVYISVLSGCDYLDNLPGIGLKTAIKLFTENPDIGDLLNILIRQKNESVEYMLNFKQAVLTFFHQKVYAIARKKIIYLNPIRSSSNKINLDFLGTNIDNKLATQIAFGIVDARTLTTRDFHIEKSFSKSGNTTLNKSSIMSFTIYWSQFQSYWRINQKKAQNANNTWAWVYGKHTAVIDNIQQTETSRLFYSVNAAVTFINHHLDKPIGPNLLFYLEKAVKAFSIPNKSRKKSLTTSAIQDFESLSLSNGKVKPKQIFNTINDETTKLFYQSIANEIRKGNITSEKRTIDISAIFECLMEEKDIIINTQNKNKLKKIWESHSSLGKVTGRNKYKLTKAWYKFLKSIKGNVNEKEHDNTQNNNSDSSIQLLDDRKSSSPIENNSKNKRKRKRKRSAMNIDEQENGNHFLQNENNNNIRKKRKLNDFEIKRIENEFEKEFTHEVSDEENEFVYDSDSSDIVLSCPMCSTIIQGNPLHSTGCTKCNLQWIIF
eukprot:353884_1